LVVTTQYQGGGLKKLTLPDEGLEVLFGPYDENIRYLESLLNVRIGARGSEVTIEGEAFPT
jgi:phosphate starvation-inducible PhoH-like protein